MSAASRDVFVSYSSMDDAIAFDVCRYLEAHRIRCWIAPRDIPGGASWTGEITSGIETCRVVVLIFTARSNVAQPVISEVTMAKDRGMAIIPLMIEDVTRSRDMKYLLSTSQWIKSSNPPQPAHFKSLLISVRERLAELDHAKPSPSIPPPKKTPGPIAGQHRNRDRSADNANLPETIDHKFAWLLGGLGAATLITLLVVIILLTGSGTTETVAQNEGSDLAETPPSDRGRAASSGNQPMTERPKAQNVPVQSPSGLQQQCNGPAQLHMVSSAALVLNGDMDGAIREATAAIAIDNGCISAWVSRGLFYFNQQKYEESIFDFTKVINELAPNSFEAYANRGWAYHRTNEFERAVEDYQEALRLSPDRSDIRQLMQRAKQHQPAP